MFFQVHGIMILSSFYKQHYLNKLFWLLLLFGESFTTHGQNSLPAPQFVSEENNFIRAVQSLPGDNMQTLPIIKNFQSQVNQIKTIIDNNEALSIIEKDKAKRSLLFLMQGITKRVKEKKIHLYDVPALMGDYRRILPAILKQQNILTLMGSFDALETELLAAAFTQYNEQSLINDLASFKRMQATPSFIYSFLETKPNFQFRDSLLLYAAANDPMSMVYYLRKNHGSLQQKIRSSNNSYVRQIALLSEEKNAVDLAIFTDELLNKEMTGPEIVATRAVPAKYFQLLVNTILSKKINDQLSVKPLQKAIKEKAIAFYINPVNELHNSTEKIRFASVNNLGAKELYFIITKGGDELYTSSYLGLYKRLMNNFTNQHADSLFDLVGWRDIPVFLRMAANYNVLADFLNKISPETTEKVFRLFVSNIEIPPGDAVEKAMDIADCFGALKTVPFARELLSKEIILNLDRCTSLQNMQGMRLYSILNDLIALTDNEEGQQRLWSILGDYENLPLSSLTDSKGQISEGVLFYGDEDGVASFQNFLQAYTDKTKWEIQKNDNWISIRSLGVTPFTIYANRPLSMEKQFDLAAQDSLFDFLEKNAIDLSILVHRGHSYHLEKTLKRVGPATKLSILGSCGGYNKAISIASINTSIQVIGSKKTGAKTINDPILDEINTTIGNGTDISWPTIWAQLADRFKNNPTALSLFEEYFPPSHNPGLFLFKLYQSNKTVALR